MPELGERRKCYLCRSRLMFSMELLATTLAEDSFLGKGTLAITQIESTARQPERRAGLQLYHHRRLTLGETEAKALAEIEGIITREAVRRKCRS